MAENKVTLGYWGIRGRAQIARLLLAYTNTPFTDKKYLAPEEWQADKKALSLTFPNLPYLIDGDFNMTESHAIDRYIARRSGHNDLLGKNLKDTAISENICGVIEDAFTPTVQLLFNPDFENAKEKVFQEKIKSKLEYLVHYLGDKDWLLGYVTIADFKLAEATHYVEGIWPEHFKEFPKLLAFRQRFEALPAIKAYYESEHAVKGPFMPPYAKWH